MNTALNQSQSSKLGKISFHVENTDTEHKRTSIWVFESDFAPENYLKNEVGDLRLLNATQNSMDGIETKYLYVREGSQTLFVVPIFYTIFEVSTLLNYKWMNPFVGWIGFRIAGLGSPIASYASYEGELNQKVTLAITNYLSEKAGIVAFKGFEPGPAFEGFVQARSLPVGVLNFDPHRWNEIKETRNISRKLKACKDLKYEFKTEVTDDEIDMIYKLYENTYNRAQIKFGKLMKSYFQKSRGNSVFILVYLQNKMVGFAQMFEKDENAIAMFLGMDYDVPRKIGLYFGIYFGIMEWVTASKIKYIDFGETTYDFKRKIGCEIKKCWIFYKHRNKLAHYVLSKSKFILEPSADELK